MIKSKEKYPNAPHRTMYSPLVLEVRQYWVSGDSFQRPIKTMVVWSFKQP